MSQGCARSSVVVDVDFYIKQLQGVYGGTSWIVAMDTWADCKNMVQDLKALGATQTLCVAVSAGAGACPDKNVVPVQDAWADLDESYPQHVDIFDPKGCVQVIAPSHDDARPLGGRRKFGGKPKTWQALEDKTIIDSFWDKVGVRRAPSRNVALREGKTLWHVHNYLNRGRGTVWVGDSTKSHHGGGEVLRWVRTKQDMEEAIKFLSTHSVYVRIMPFLEGVPCSIHGIVFDDYVIALRPCEMLFFRKERSTKLFYGASATFWDPEDEDREYMRRMAKDVGAYLREHIGYRGAFTIDGIMSKQGFLPTELNPRFGAALETLAMSLPKVPMTLLNRALIERVDVDWQPHDLEVMWLERVDAVRHGLVHVCVSKTCQETTHRGIIEDDGAFRWAIDDELYDAKLMVGPSPVGSVVDVSFVSTRVEYGPPFAPRAARVLSFVDRALGLGIGELKTPREVRPATRTAYT